MVLECVQQPVADVFDDACVAGRDRRVGRLHLLREGKEFRRWPLPSPHGYRDRRVRDRPVRKCSRPILPIWQPKRRRGFRLSHLACRAIVEMFADMLPAFRMKYAALGSIFLMSRPELNKRKIQVRTTGAVSGRPRRLAVGEPPTTGPCRRNARQQTRNLRRPDPAGNHEEAAEESDGRCANEAENSTHRFSMSCCLAQDEIVNQIHVRENGRTLQKVHDSTRCAGCAWRHHSTQDVSRRLIPGAKRGCG